MREWRTMDSQLCRDGHDVAMNADWQVSSWDVLVPEHEERQELATLANRPGKSNSGIYWVQRRARVVRWERQPASLGHAGGRVLSLPETFQWNINAVSFQFIHNVYKPVPVLVVLSSVQVFYIPGRDSSQSEEPLQLLGDTQEPMDDFLSSNMGSSSEESWADQGLRHEFLFRAASSSWAVGGPAWGCLAGELIFLVELIKQALKQGAEPGSSAASHPHVLGQALSQTCKGPVIPRPGLDLCPTCRSDGVGSRFRGSPAAVAIAVCLGLAAVSETLCANQVLRNRGTVPRAWSQHKHLRYLMVCSCF